jgi:predicted TPR repeat methyltransferase
MPESQQPAEGQAIMLELILRNPRVSVLDVGAGDGKWGALLRGRVRHVTGLEVWEPYVSKYGLEHVYDRVVVHDARTFDRWLEFDVVIFGDVLEHMPRADAETIVRRLRFPLGPDAFLTIPVTECVQDGAAYGNPYETHIEQWTHEQLATLGWRQLHVGPNPNGRVQIGTYKLGGYKREG